MANKDTNTRKLTEIFDAYRKLKSLPAEKKRQQAVIVTVLSAAMFFYFVYKPQTGKIEDIKKQVRIYRNRNISLAEEADIDGESRKSEISKLQEVIGRFDKKIKAMESGLPHLGDIPQVLAAFVSIADVCGVELVTINPEYPEELIGTYRTMLIRLNIEGRYSSVIDFVRDIEEKLNFIGIGNISMKTDGKEVETISTDLKISVLLNNAAGQRKTARGGAGGTDDTVQPVRDMFRDPFLTVEVPKKSGPKKLIKLKVTGITLFGERSSAIINDAVYGLNDEIEGKKIARIERNYVVLHDDENDYVLILNEMEEDSKGE